MWKWGLAGICCVYGYRKVTEFEKNVLMIQKLGNYKVLTDKGIFVVSNNILHNDIGKFASSKWDTYDNISPGHTFHVTGYGLSIPLFYTHPRIFSVTSPCDTNHCKEKESLLSRIL
jgi:hypothetical protein